jgi:putative hemolysin
VLRRALLALPLALGPLPAAAQGNPETPNPAAVFCEERGGTFEIRQNEAGAQGLCRLPDGSLVDAWDHFRENWDKAPET